MGLIDPVHVVSKVWCVLVYYTLTSVVGTLRPDSATDWTEIGTKLASGSDFHN